MYIVNRPVLRTVFVSNAETARPVGASEEYGIHPFYELSDGGRRLRNAVAVVLSLQIAFCAVPMYGGEFAANAQESASAWQLAQSNPTEIMRQTLRNEIASSYGNRAPLRYRLKKISATSNTVKQIVETADGGVSRLIESDGKPLSTVQQRQEIERLKALDRDPSIEAHRRRNETRDVERTRKFMRLLPDAFVYQYAGSLKHAKGTFIRLTFEPNPKFSPPDFESRILTGIHGEIWIDPADLRIAHIEGKTFRQVDFGWGILGTLYPGGTLLIEQTNTSTCGWQLSHLELHLQGKELIFKSLHIELKETAEDYERTPKNWTYHDAVRWLLAMPMSAESTGQTLTQGE